MGIRRAPGRTERGSGRSGVPEAPRRADRWPRRAGHPRHGACGGPGWAVQSARARLLLGRLDEAEACYDAAEAEPERTDEQAVRTAYGRALLSLTRGDTDRARRLLDEATRGLSSTTDLSVHTDIAVSRATLCRARGQHAEALSSWQEARRLADRVGSRPARVDAWIGTGDALRQLGRLDEAEAAFVRAADLSAADGLPIVVPAVNRVLVLLDRHRYEQAAAALAALRSEPLVDLMPVLRHGTRHMALLAAVGSAQWDEAAELVELLEQDPPPPDPENASLARAAVALAAGHGRAALEQRIGALLDRRPGGPVQLLFATNNAHKVAEVRQILAGTGVTVQTLSEHGLDVDPPETGDTFEHNALQKARFVHERTGLPCIADDSGIEVDALDGAPGVHSKRFSPQATAEANNALLLERLAGVPDTERTARFRCVLALVGLGPDRTVDGRCEGRIAHGLSGSGGFGYDPLFLPDEAPGRSMAELSAEEKNAISHRGRAFRQLPTLLEDAKG